jgi:poly-gamma-glutamate synthesis protein (capsule biosynthesis protein)
MSGKRIVRRNSMKKILVAILVLVIIGLGYFAFSRYLVSKLDGRGSVVANIIDKEEPTPVRILFVGDIMLDRVVRRHIDNKGFKYQFEGVMPLFENNDIATGNLEGTITSNPSLSEKDFSVLRFTFDPQVVEELKGLGFSGFSLANNHAYDFGSEGFLETQANLERAGLFSFGSPYNDLNLLSSVDSKNEHICFVGYHALYRRDIQPVVEAVTKGREACTYIIVFAHWGDEYTDVPTAKQKDAAHSFIDAGADLVIGAHPHVVQPIEIYKDKAIFYSLGNFIFDQDFLRATQLGLAVKLELSTSTQKFALVPIEMKNTKLSFPGENAFAPRIDVLLSGLPEGERGGIRGDRTLTLPRK